MNGPETLNLDSALMGAEEAYAQCVRTDQVTAVLREASAGGDGAPSSAPDLETALVAAADAAPRPPAMPETRAVLRKLPAHGTFPGAEYRLAGDRCDGRGSVLWELAFQQNPLTYAKNPCLQLKCDMQQALKLI